MTFATLTHDYLAQLSDFHSFPVKQAGIVLWGLRGVRPANAQLSKTDWDYAQSHELNDARLADGTLDHLQLRCTIVQWRPAQRDLAVFAASTVPSLEMIHSQPPGEVNQLATGRFTHEPGDYHGFRVLRQQHGTNWPIQRTRDNDYYDQADPVVFEGERGDHLHPAWTDVRTKLGGNVSKGCQVIIGWPPKNGKGERGGWAVFAERIYDSGQNPFYYQLIRAIDMPEAHEEGVPFHTARFGSKGDRVTRLQAALKADGYPVSDPDSEFGRTTCLAVIAVNTRLNRRGPGDSRAIADHETATALGIAWP